MEVPMKIHSTENRRPKVLLNGARMIAAVVAALASMAIGAHAQESTGFRAGTSGPPPEISTFQPSTGVPGAPSATTTIEGNQLPPPPQKFEGRIERNATQSTPWWPARVVPPKGAPNILLIMTDDTGFGVTTTFGGVIPTPTLDRIAANGLRYTNFNSTALCSPTRAAIITGRNHHSRL